MGIYTDITESLVAEFNGDLADAVKAVTVTEFGTPVYDPITGTNSPSETVYVTRGVPTVNVEGDIMDENNRTNVIELLILDFEKQVTEFKVGMKILVDGFTQTYKVSGVSIDPAGVTHTLQCRRWSNG